MLKSSLWRLSVKRHGIDGGLVKMQQRLRARPLCWRERAASASQACIGMDAHAQ